MTFRHCQSVTVADSKSTFTKFYFEIDDEKRKNNDPLIPI